MKKCRIGFLCKNAGTGFSSGFKHEKVENVENFRIVPKQTDKTDSFKSLHLSFPYNIE